MVNDDQPDAHQPPHKKIRGHAKRLTMGILCADWPYMQKDIAQNTIGNDTDNRQRGHVKRLDMAVLFADWPQYQRGVAQYTMRQNIAPT